MMTRLTAADLAAIEARLQTLPPGPWTVNPPGGDQVLDSTGQLVAIVPSSVTSAATAEAIAHSREDVENLVAELRHRGLR